MKIVIATGGSAGHIFPALKVAEQLKRKGHVVLFAGAFTRSLSYIERSGCAFTAISARGMALWPPQRAVVAFYFMLQSIGESLRILKKFKPDVVCGFGGYGSFPVVLVAAFLRYPTLIHEQNVVPGKANCLLAKFVQRIALTFKESMQYFPSGKTVVTGCPCHAQFPDESREKLIARFQLDPQKRTILVLGGSQGSHRINLELMNTIESLKKRGDVQVIHVSGNKDYQDLKFFYEQSGIPFQLFDFLEDMGGAYKVADLVVSRAGAVTVLEIARFRIPAILIPYPFAGGHQKENAKILNLTGWARMIDEKDLNASALQQTMMELLGKSFNREEMKKSVENIFIPEAGSRIAEEIIRLGGHI